MGLIAGEISGSEEENEVNAHENHLEHFNAFLL